jgi:predicted nucleic acid-binding protein
VKVLIDTNVVLDIALNRKLFVEHASLLWRLAIAIRELVK